MSTCADESSLNLELPSLLVNKLDLRPVCITVRLNMAQQACQDNAVCAQNDIEHAFGAKLASDLPVESNESAALGFRIKGVGE